LGGPGAADGDRPCYPGAASCSLRALPAAARPGPVPGRDLAGIPGTGCPCGGPGSRGERRARQIGRIDVIQSGRGPTDRAARAVRRVLGRSRSGGLLLVFLPHAHTDGYAPGLVDTISPRVGICPSGTQDLPLWNTNSCMYRMVPWQFSAPTNPASSAGATAGTAGSTPWPRPPWRPLA